jgi:hypothetical protein
MCYSKETSMMSFLFGITTSFLLIHYGNKSSNLTNKTIGYFYMFISFMQFIEYLIWSDMDCVNGNNEFASTFGPLLTNLQPVILLLIASMYLESSNILPNEIVIVSNIIYLGYVGYKYYYYIQDESNLCIKENTQKHLDWTWKKDFNYNYYHLMILINIINFSSNINLDSSICFTYILLFASAYNFKENIGEYWCLLSTSVPLLNLFMQKVLDINN